MMTLAQAHHLLVQAVPSAQLIGDPSVEIARVHTDTRTLQQGDFFVALRGEHFDANDYLPQAASDCL